MKILIVANYKESAGGISGQVRLLHYYLRKEGIDADIFSTKGSILDRIRYYWQLIKKAKYYDVIHVHCCSYFGFYPAIVGNHAAKKNHKRLVLTYHGGGGEKFFDKYRLFVRHYLLNTDANIVLSGFLARIFDKHKLPYTIVPNILEQTVSMKFSRTEVRPRFISVRTLEPIYNIECILRAFKTVKARIPEATLDVLGDGKCRESLEKYVADNYLKDVTFVGRVPNSSINDYLQKNDVFISMPFIDNQPMSVLEAWRNGLLVISSNVGGVPYLVEDGVTGILIPNDNSDCLAERMIQAIVQSNESLQIMKNGNAQLVKYSWDNIKQQILTIYNRF